MRDDLQGAGPLGDDILGLDADQDGIGCEDPAAFAAAAPTDTTAPPADAPAADDSGTAEPATPV